MLMLMLMLADALVDTRAYDADTDCDALTLWAIMFMLL